MTLSVRLEHQFPQIRMDIAFEVPAAGITVLFGPSGSGKSTVINAAAGLLRPDVCRISVHGQVLIDTECAIWLPPEKRRIGLVFQSSRLFPHMSVETNLRFGFRRVASGPIAFDTVVDLLDIRALLRRRPHTLSGGELQRVAIGRALLAQPHLLLMDEPLASLDALRKAEIMPFLTRLNRTLPYFYPIYLTMNETWRARSQADRTIPLDTGRIGLIRCLMHIAKVPQPQRPPLVPAARDLPRGRQGQESHAGQPLQTTGRAHRNPARRAAR